MSDLEFFIPARHLDFVYDRIESLERRSSLMLGSTIASWLLVLAMAVASEPPRSNEMAAAPRGDLFITGDVPKGR